MELCAEVAINSIIAEREVSLSMEQKPGLAGRSKRSSDWGVDVETAAHTGVKGFWTGARPSRPPAHNGTSRSAPGCFAKLTARSGAT